MGLTKKLLFAFNALFVIAGILLLALGIYVRVQDNDINSVFGKGGPMTPSNMMIAVGVIIFLVAAFGCIGAIRESKCLLIIFIVFLIVILILEITLIVLGIKYKSKAKEYATKGIVSVITSSYGESGNSAFTKGVDKIQEKWKCCGADNYTEWRNSKWSKKNPTLRVPKSCCIHSDKEPNCNKFNSSLSYINTAPCAVNLENWAVKNLKIVYGLGIFVALIEILGIIMATIVMKSTDSEGTAA